jgi:hypothetical protein
MKIDLKGILLQGSLALDNWQWVEQHSRGLASEAIP